ncbi:hypothetical protein QFZ88_005884 [Mesorhizobium sp. YL-MeA3-2017]|jgi:hypothetical protein|uniref:hypothetical protein n=1 Tax=Mesorhizobium sp. YL-MeA3-2017 TaxID=3042284 RepID=UPI0017FC68F3|nr:hypothetical protein [Mesorhizobium sp. YL-MeA3-2017]MDQ0333502.1 hypothetical protein [Mesorhizobium sp. YL-MeA3-2017]
MTNHTETRVINVFALAIVVLWVGLLAGVSFLATPAKFLAPSLTLPVALDVGRHTFAIFNKTEWLLAVAALLVVLLSRPRSGIANAGCALAALLVALETVWLLPVLDQRVGLIIAGQQLPASNLHNIYIGIEMAKLLGLIVISFVIGRRLAHR